MTICLCYYKLEQLHTHTTHTHTQADSAVSQLREAAQEIANIPPLPPSGLSEEQLDRLRELEEVTTDQERGVAQLTNQVRRNAISTYVSHSIISELPY